MLKFLLGLYLDSCNIFLLLSFFPNSFSWLMLLMKWILDEQVSHCYSLQRYVFTNLPQREIIKNGVYQFISPCINKKEKTLRLRIACIHWDDYLSLSLCIQEVQCAITTTTTSFVYIHYMSGQFLGHSISQSKSQQSLLKHNHKAVYREYAQVNNKTFGALMQYYN